MSLSRANEESLTKNFSHGRPPSPDKLSQETQMHRPREMPCCRNRTNGIHPSDDHPHHRSTHVETFLSTTQTQTHLYSLTPSFLTSHRIALLFFYIYTLLVFVTETLIEPFRVGHFFYPLHLLCSVFCCMFCFPRYPHPQTIVTLVVRIPNSSRNA